MESMQKLILGPNTEGLTLVFQMPRAEFLSQTVSGRVNRGIGYSGEEHFKLSHKMSYLNLNI